MARNKIWGELLMPSYPVRTSMPDDCALILLETAFSLWLCDRCAVPWRGLGAEGLDVVAVVGQSGFAAAAEGLGEGGFA